MSKTVYFFFLGWGGGFVFQMVFFVAFYVQNTKSLHHSSFAFSVFLIGASLLMFNYVGPVAQSV